MRSAAPYTAARYLGADADDLQFQHSDLEIDMRSTLAKLTSLVSASFFVTMSNAAITTMIAILVAEAGGEQSDVALIAACYSVGFLAHAKKRVRALFMELQNVLRRRRDRRTEIYCN